MTDKNGLNFLKQCLILLPGYELDGYPRNLESAQADAFLSGWVSLWHPAMLKATDSIPAWQQAGSAPSDLSGSLILVPEFSQSDMDAGYETSEDSIVIPPKGGWREFQAELLGLCGLGDDGTSSELVDRHLEDFAALGFAYLQIQLMTRQLRYTSNLDQLLFAEQVVAAAEACLANDAEKAEETIQACFDTLGQERDHYYSLDVQLLDVTLLAPSVLGKSLTSQLAAENPKSSFLASAEILESLRAKNLEGFEALKSQIQSEKACIVGGLDRERPHPLMARESILRDLDAGRKAYNSLELDYPKVFGRMSYGLTTDHAAELKRSGFAGVFLTAWSEGSYPEGSQTKISWESSDGTFVSAIASDIRDASDPNSFLALGWDVGDALDHQHVPTLVFAHWPGLYSPYYSLLQAIVRRTPALGRFSLADAYFADTDEPYHQERLNWSDFKQNWLARSESPATLMSATKAFHTLSVRARALQNLANLIWQLKNYRPSDLSSGGNVAVEQLEASESGAEGQANFAGLSASRDWMDTNLEDLIKLVDGLLDKTLNWKELSAEGMEIADKCANDYLQELRRILLNQGEELGTPTGRLLMNPRSFPQRVRVQTDNDREFADGSWKFASGRAGHDRYTCIDLPAFGFVVAPFGKAEKTARQHHLAEIGGVIQNEFLEAQVDGKRGHLRSLYMPGKRGNRLSLMVARRDRDAKGKYVYSEMQAKDVRMLTSSNVCGLIRATGKLRRDGQTLGEFEIDYEIWRGSRILEVAVRLSQLEKLVDRSPWNSAYVLRIAWPTEAAILRTFQCGRRHPWPGGQAVSPHLIEIDEADYVTQLLTGGLIFHRRREERFLETLLEFDATKRESECRVGIGVDLPHPLQAAEDFLDRRYSIPIYGDDAKESQGWFVSANAKNVAVHLDAPLRDAEGHTVGMRLFVQESAGKSTNTKIRLMHSLKFARRVDHCGQDLGKLTTAEDSVTIALRANEQCNVDVIWQ